MSSIHYCLFLFAWWLPVFLFSMCKSFVANTSLFLFVWWLNCFFIQFVQKFCPRFRLATFNAPGISTQPHPEEEQACISQKIEKMEQHEQKKKAGAGGRVKVILFPVYRLPAFAIRTTAKRGQDCYCLHWNGLCTSPLSVHAVYIY